MMPTKALGRSSTKRESRSRFKSYYDAYYYAYDNGYTTNEINSKELETLRKTDWPW
jgi:hypothetical protein